MKPELIKHGGARKGAGRKKIKRGPSTTISLTADEKVVLTFKKKCQANGLTFRQGFESAVIQWGCRGKRPDLINPTQKEVSNS